MRFNSFRTAVKETLQNIDRDAGMFTAAEGPRMRRTHDRRHSCLVLTASFRRQSSEILNLSERRAVGRLATECLVCTGGVLRGHAQRHAVATMAVALVGAHVDLLVLQPATEARNKDDVAPASSAVHADVDPFALEPFGELQDREMTTRLDVEDLASAVTHSL